MRSVSVYILSSGMQLHSVFEDDVQQKYEKKSENN